MPSYPAVTVPSLACRQKGRAEPGIYATTSCRCSWKRRRHLFTKAVFVALARKSFVLLTKELAQFADQILDMKTAQAFMLQQALFVYYQ